MNILFWPEPHYQQQIRFLNKSQNIQYLLFSRDALIASALLNQLSELSIVAALIYSGKASVTNEQVLELSLSDDCMYPCKLMYVSA